MRITIKLKGKVCSRSSIKPGGPPGETEIQRKNPQRIKLILEKTGWPRVEAGTLNVDCYDEEPGQILSTVQPKFFEPPGFVDYPTPYESIPLNRKGYNYYEGILNCGNLSESVLVRRAVNPSPALPKRVEVFAENKLKDAGVAEGADVELTVFDG